MKKLLVLLALVFVLVSTGNSLFAQAAAEPTLALKVQVITSGTTSENVVVFTAKLSQYVISSKPIYIDFYNGSPILTVYPNNYLGSAPVNNKGIAVLKIKNHKPGKFAGGAIWDDSPWGTIFSPVVFYVVP